MARQAALRRILGCRATRPEPEKRPFIGASSVTWTRLDHALVERGVDSSWCAILVRGSRASLSKRGLRTRGVTTWSFRQPRRSPCQYRSSRWTPGTRDGGRARSRPEVGSGSLTPIASVEGPHVAVGELAERPSLGQCRLRRGQVVEIQRSRLVVAVVELVGEIGHEWPAVAAVIAQALLSRKRACDALRRAVLAYIVKLNLLSKP
jgi:hypothetical protein